MPSIYIDSIDITLEEGLKKLKYYFNLSHANAFYQFHAELIKNNSFVYFGSTYKIEKGKPVLEISKELKDYKRIGPDFFRIIQDATYNDDGEKVREEESLVPWKVSEILRDHGKGSDQNIERYLGFTNVASHLNYQKIIDGKWNLYNDISHVTAKGEFPTIDYLLRHIFQEQYEMALDYMTLLYTRPYQKLPVLCLVSKEEGTGKSSFIQLLSMIYQNNMALVSSEDIMGSWNITLGIKINCGIRRNVF